MTEYRRLKNRIIRIDDKRYEKPGYGGNPVSFFVYRKTLQVFP